MSSSPRVQRLSQLVAWVAGLNFLALWVLLASIPSWAPEAPRDTYTHPVQFRGNHIRYVPSPVGRYVDLGLWVHFGLLAASLGVARWLRPRPTE